MVVTQDEIYKVLNQFNPWWRGLPVGDLPNWQRAAYKALWAWVSAPPTRRAVLLSGARQIGKTTLMLQAVDALLKKGTAPSNIIYATFDHPILKLAGIDAVLDAWRERVAAAPGQSFLFLDEAQFIPDWGTWIKHQVDFRKDRHIIRLATLSFYEYLKIKHIALPELPKLKSLTALFSWTDAQRQHASALGQDYIAHYHEYLVRGGFPQTALIQSITQAQRLLREDIIDKVLKRDMTALFGVRNVLDLERTFLYLCRHDGGLLDMKALCENLEVKRPTAQNYIRYLEDAHLIYRLEPHGYGKDVLRGQFKIYLADAAIAPSVMMQGMDMIQDTEALGIATESAVFRHLFAHYCASNVRFSYWRGKKELEVDVLADVAGQIVPFEIKYRGQNTDVRYLKGLMELCRAKQMQRAYVVTKSLDDFGVLPNTPQDVSTQVMKVPAALLCYWMGAMELDAPE
jgi:uncharacterized protein